MDTFDPGNWTIEYIEENAADCLKVLHEHNERAVDLICGTEYEAAITEIKAIINGLAKMDFARFEIRKSWLCTYNWVCGDITAFGTTHTPGLERKAAALEHYENAYEYADDNEAAGNLKSRISEFKSKKSVNKIKSKYIQKFPGYQAELLKNLSSELSESIEYALNNNPIQAEPKKTHKTVIYAIVVIVLIVGVIAALLASGIVSLDKNETLVNESNISTSLIETQTQAHTEESEPESTEAVTTQEETTQAKTQLKAFIMPDIGLRLRSQASTNSNSVLIMKHGEEITILGFDGDWANVEYKDTDGWCHRDYIDINKAVKHPDNLNKSDTAYVSEDDADLLFSADSSAEKIMSIDAGSEVTVLAYSDDYAFVRYNENHGWCKKSFLSDKKAEAASTTENADENTSNAANQ